ncbi:ribosome assembly cofactor RimP [Parasphaerochaeta coccoides]|uniref:Ribosome maturation factor RimP n=1 Tax=Parasphaerochaeta coccoides (strain ATCC BAA-1237 / DSM 17374 / SPN1) TaxID=760011 RepID=F4GK48_PARC1|nr:ribosome assembly cofactor RimP [Parasphaerochaeta coccoides]AEC01820.1 Ribosome maturation factor rimP [Parasphaerochaeta coccoides DSM 17374]
MLKNELVSNEIYKELNPLVRSLGLDIVSVSRNVRQGASSVFLVIKASGRPTSVDDCAKVHRLVASRLEMLWQDRELSLEVSTPGLQRNFSDVQEFSLFTGDRVRIFDSQEEQWISGIIDEVSDAGVILTQVVGETAEPLAERMNIPYDRIKKAKLDYIWEDGAHVN